jgi:hypothetical protein
MTPEDAVAAGERGIAAKSPETIREILATLNALALNEVSRIHGQLDRVREALVRLGQPELEARLADAQRSLRAGEMREFRRAVANVTARLGHLR